MNFYYYLLSYFVIFACQTTVIANDSFGGHIKYHLATAKYKLNNTFDIRLLTDKYWQNWHFQVHYEILALTEDNLPNNTLIDDYRLFNFSHEWNNEDVNAVHRLDRLILDYTGKQLVVRFGRQAVSWGNGFIFHPLDIFNPFSPIEIDKDYKSGDDMFYGQWLFDNGNDLQSIILPRRNIKTNKLESELSSFALKYQGNSTNIGNFDLIAARHFDENMLGFGISQDVWEAVWRFNLSVTELATENVVIALVTNIDYSWELFEHNFYGYLEYFYNELGETQAENYFYPNMALQNRLQLGEFYTRGQNYLAAGMQIEITPLFNIFTNLISNLHDNSLFFQIRGIYDWTENLQLITWLDFPVGEKDTEFGGMEVTESDYLSSETRAYLRLTYYF